MRDSLDGLAVIDAVVKVVVVGQGGVGLPLAMRAVHAGYDVVGYDVDELCVKRLRSAETDVDGVPSTELAAGLASRRYRPTSDPADCADFDVAVITVPTLLREGTPDLSHIESAAYLLAGYLRRGATVILESAAYPGTTEELLAPLLENGSGLAAGSEFFVGYSPERSSPGNGTWGLVSTPKLVAGIDAGSLATVQGFYNTIVEHTVPVSGCKEAELAKLLENAFHHVNLALVNELAMFAGDLDVNMWESIDAAATKPFGFMRFTPDRGVGGRCLPMDPSHLAWLGRRALGQSFRFVEMANAINGHMLDYVVRRITEGLNRRHQAVNGSRILLIGPSDADTSEDRESPALVVAQRLRALDADVRIADFRIIFEAHELSAADAVVLLTDDDDGDIEAVRAHASYVLDTRRRLAPGPGVEYL